MLRRITFVCLLGCLAGDVCAQPIDAAFSSPDADRWFYGFNGTPGTRPEASCFGAIGEPDFDDRDAQVMLEWTTSGVVPSGLGVDQYRVLSARVRATISRDLAFTYDDSFDVLDTYTGVTADSDAGRPLELYPVGFRNGTGFSEGLAYWPGAPFPFPALRIRNAFVCNFDAEKVAFDISTNVRDGFEVTPIGIGLDLNPDVVSRLAPGDLVPLETTFTFEVDLTRASTRAYLRDQLNGGALLLGISSLTQVTGQGDPSTPAFDMRENPFGTPAMLELSVCTGSPADFDCSGDVTVLDLLDFLSLWFVDGADFNLDDETDVLDLLDFLAIWFEG